MSLLLHGGSLIDGTGTDPRANTALLIEGERIRTIDSTGRRTAADELIDVTGLTVLPGLIDAHAHFGAVSGGEPHLPPAVLAARIFRNCRLALDAGFTTVRDTGGIDGGVARAVASGLMDGPRIYPSGPMISQSGGHADNSSPFAPHHAAQLHGIPGLVQGGLVVDGPEDMTRTVRGVFARGATQLKVCVSGGLISLTDLAEHPQLSVAELAAAVAEADARDTYVTAHAHNVRGIRAGLEAGLSCFEHGTYLDEETAAAMAEAPAYLVPTLAIIELIRTDYADQVTDEMLAKLDGADTASVQSLKLAREAGVAVGLGSDLLGPEQRRRGLELVVRARAEDPMRAIVSATATNAQIIRRSDDLGTVAPGKLADLTVLDADPLTEPAAFDDPDRVKLVVKGGVIVKNTLGRRLE